MRIIGVYNIKGGVGKTATAVNLAYLSAGQNQPTLLCDLDPQGSASYYFRVKAKIKAGKKVILRGGKKFAENIKATDYPGLDILPSDFSFRNLDISLDHANHSKNVLRKTLKNLNEEYKYIFVDCPPNITLVSENVFKSVDFLLVPLIPTTLSFRSFEKLITFYRKKRLPAKSIIPFFSMIEKRKTMHQDFMLKVIETYPQVLKNGIPYSSLIEKMGIYREPVVAFHPNSSASQAYRALWQELYEYIITKDK